MREQWPQFPFHDTRASKSRMRGHSKKPEGPGSRLLKPFAAHSNSHMHRHGSADNQHPEIRNAGRSQITSTWQPGALAPNQARESIAALAEATRSPTPPPLSRLHCRQLSRSRRPPTLPSLHGRLGIPGRAAMTAATVGAHAIRESRVWSAAEPIGWRLRGREKLWAAESLCLRR
jgi:hypothetical protein